MKELMPILVTGVGGRSVGHQVIQAVTLAGNGYRPVVTDAVTFSYGLYNTERRYILPAANSPEYLDAVRRLVAREKIVAILPGSGPETEVLVENAATLGNGCHVIANPLNVIRLCKDKKNMQEWLSCKGFAVPKSVMGSQWRQLVNEVGYPIVAKPREESGGSRGVAILASDDEVKMYLPSTSQDKVMFQEYVEGVDTEYTVGVMVSRDGEIIDSIVVHRHLVGMSMGVHREVKGKLYGLSTGYSQGTIRKHEDIQATCESLALKLGARGPLNIQLRYSGGKAVIFEVHPRFSGTTSIRAQAGFNEADTLIRNFVLGEKFGRINYQTDVVAIRALSNLIVSGRDMNSVPRA
jgi:carbamoyl-phosphate synthase large subunit